MNIAYVCYQPVGNFSVIENENDLLLEFLQKKGLSIQKEIWDDPKVDWTKYELAIIKAPWDYFDKYEQFLQWLTLLESLNISLLNPVSTIRWNSDKHYLKDIENEGFEVIPFQFIEKKENTDLSKYFKLFNCEKLIIKPTISGGAKNTFAVTKTEIDQISPTIYSLLQEESFMVQPFIKEIQKEGEWSFLFFNGKFSHCILKKVKSGDFRVQHIHGGSVHPVKNPPAELLKSAEEYINTFANDCLYARVDGVVINGKFSLMELELIEPYLYLFTHEEGFENYYLALQELLKPVKETVN